MTNKQAKKSKGDDDGLKASLLKTEPWVALDDAPVFEAELTAEEEAKGKILMGTSRWVFVRESRKTTLYTPEVMLLGIL